MGSKHGNLARKLRVIIERLKPIVGFNADILERAGQILRKSLSNNDPWKGGETLDCRKRSLIYEKICEACNPREGNHKNNSWEELRDTRVGVSPASMWVKRLPHAQALNHEREGDPRFRFTIIK